MALRSVNEIDSATVVSIPLDVRGWDVRTISDDEKVGGVHDVLVDDTGAARYLDIDLGIFRKHVLLPIGQAAADPEDDVVWVQALNSKEFNDIPEYVHDTAAVDADVEQRLTTSYDRIAVAYRYDRPEYGGRLPHERVTDPAVLGTEEVRLRRLTELGEYRVAADNPDPRGWELVGPAGERIGEVEDLIVDPQALKARYLDVELDNAVRVTRAAERALIPVGYARLDENSRQVRVDSLNRSEAAALPVYRDEFDDAYEDRVDRHFAQRMTGSSRYQHPRYDAERLYAPRVVIDRHAPERTSRICEVRLAR